MKFSDLDILLKYEIMKAEAELAYDGSPNKYFRGCSLEIFPDDDLVNHSRPLFVFGTVVYLTYGENILMLKPTKDNRVVDTLTGLGGKVKALVNGRALSQEKADISTILNEYRFGSLGTEEDLRVAAAREVMEETGTYSKDENGKYTHNMIKQGIVINPAKLRDVGVSRIRLINEGKTESWLIQNYGYELTDEEYMYILDNVAIENREGILRWYAKEDVYPLVSYADQMILRLENKDVVVSEIRDMVNNQNIFRVLVKGKNPEIVSYVNGKKVYSNSDRLEMKIDSIKLKK